MPSMSDHPSSDIAKLMIVGESGCGKTSLLAGLANEGYKVRILDFDNGLDTLSTYLTKEGMENVHYITLRDKLGEASAFPAAVNLISDWVIAKNKKTEELYYGPTARTEIKRGTAELVEDFGKIRTWGKDTIMVIDSLTFMSKGALTSVLKFNNKKATAQPSQADWGAAIRDVEHIMQLITSDEIECNVLVNTHITAIEVAEGMFRSFPSCIGNKLPQQIGRYFNTVLRMQSKVRGKDVFRTFRTVSDNRMELKNTAPKLLDADMDADILKVFKALKS